MRVRWLLQSLALVGLLFPIACQAGTSTPDPTASPEPPSAIPTARPSATETSSSLPTPSGEGTGNADVLHVMAEEQSDGTWVFRVTVEHPDTGWEDYANGWDVVTPEGTVLKPKPDSPFTRELLHPHVDEQPFTRSQAGIEIPEGVTQVRVRAHDIVDGYGGKEVVVDLTASSGPDFEVEWAP